MKLELVLNEDEKKERFKVALAKKKDFHETSNETSTVSTSLEEDNVYEGRDMESIYSNSPSSSINSSPSSSSLEIQMNRSFSIAQVSPFRRPISSYNQPTVRVAPMRKSSNLSCSPELMASSSTSAWEQSITSNLGLSQISTNSEFFRNSEPRPTITATYHNRNPSTAQTTVVENNQDLPGIRETSSYHPFPYIPPLEPIQTYQNLFPWSPFDHSSTKQPIIHPPNTALDLSRPSLYERKSVIVAGPRAQHRPRESVNPVSTSDHQEQARTACEDVNQGTLGLNDLKEEQIQECDDAMIFTYVHKMFRTKDRKWMGRINTADAEEEASKENCPLNRSVV